MGKKGNWFGAVKKVFSPESKESKNKSQNEQKTPRSKKKWGFGRQKNTDLNTTACAQPGLCTGRFAAPPPPTPAEEITKLTRTDKEQNKQAYTIALATVEAAEAAIIAANAAAEVVHLTATAPRFPSMTREETSAVKIQTIFRGYMARRAQRALKGLVRLKSVVHGDSVKRQSATTLRCMQIFARLQSEIRSRRINMTEEKQSLQRQVQLKREKELDAAALNSSPIGDDWNTSLQSKEKIEANITRKHEAAMKRERALAYAYSHQWKTSLARSVNVMFADPNNPNWGWSWMERWMVSSKTLQSPWENAADKDSTTTKVSRRQLPSTPATLSTRIKLRPASPRRRRDLHHLPPDEDAKSILSVHSEWNKRHSIAGSSVRDDESLASSPSIPSYMTPTESARAKSRMQNINPLILDLNETTETMASSVASVGYAKKRLSFPATDKRGNNAVARRHSGPPTVNVG